MELQSKWWLRYFDLEKFFAIRPLKPYYYSYMPKYSFKQIEAKWNKKWAKDKIYEPSFAKASKGKPFYNLMMFPYPSAEGLHIGGARTFTGVDIYGRLKRMQGHDVLEPIGLDGFGIHSENYALKVHKHPTKHAKDSEKNFYRQLRMLGNGFAWDEHLETYDPEYYRWTQWIFIQMFKNGLAYRKKQAVNWCPSCKTVLSDEQAEGGACERCGSAVDKRDLEQWFFRITKYAERLLKNLSKIDWTEKIKIAQRNWIGQSEGVNFSFPLEIKTNYVFLHGFAASPEKNFWPWLKDKLEERGHEVQAPSLPKAGTLEIEEKVNYVLSQVSFSDETVVVAHSLGCLVALQALPQLKTTIRKLILVAPPFPLNQKKNVIDRKSLWGKFNFKSITKKVQEIVVLADLEDHLVPVVEQEAVAKLLKAKLLKGTASSRHFLGRIAPEVLGEADTSVAVFTTRADTVFGVTYLVIAPEHPLIQAYRSSIQNYKEVAAYIRRSIQKKERERLTENQEKAGVELKGLHALHPITHEHLPIWVADYVLGGYGTGAIMAVPAHDERDFAFAQIFHLPIKQVIAPSLYDYQNPPQEGKENTFRNTILAILYNPKTKKYLILKWKKQPYSSFITGGVEGAEDWVEAAKREIVEETGYTNLKFVRSLGMTETHFFAAHKDVNRKTLREHLLFELIDESREKVSKEERERYEIQWLTYEELKKIKLTHVESEILLRRLAGENNIYTDEGVLINSGEFDGLTSAEAKERLLKPLGGKKEVRYRLRDWLISRQRYWGSPIPMIYCKECATSGQGERREMPGWYTVPEKQLPVILPYVKNFRPTGSGASPLAAKPEFYKVHCPRCGAMARRETDVSDTFLDSAWYYLRYPSANYTKGAWNQKITKQWLPVNSYIGGAEHAVLHLLYSRFLTMVFFDLSLLHFEEPFVKFRAHGLITKDGAKMSKSKGNVVNPDEYFKQFGADAMRLYLAFLAPFEQGGDFRDGGISGSTRFLERAWKKGQEISREKTKRTDTVAKKAIHKAIKKVSEDIESLRYNTAISALMICLNEIEGIKVSLADWKIFLQLLSPFAPYIAEELWHDAGGRKSIHISRWPIHDALRLEEGVVTIVIQINGKVRDSIETTKGRPDKEIETEVLEREKIKTYLKGVRPRKVIYIPNRLMNIVI
jgi:leucyl-tRNA synthetase